MNITSGVGDTKSNNPKKKSRDCQRLIFEDSKKYKYAEIITFSNTSISNNYALTIGLNPALLDTTKFDSTNRKIANFIKNSPNKYDGYILYNLYSVISGNSSTLCKHIVQNPMDVKNNMQNAILEMLKYFSGDVYLFWGPNAIEKRLITNLDILFYIQQTLITKKYYYSADSNQKFVHPGNQKFSSFHRLTSITQII